MEKAHIKIFIQPMNYDHKYSQEYKLMLDTPFIGEELESIHEVIPFTSGDLNPDELIRQRNIVIMGRREQIANSLAHAFATKIIETMEADDSINGYSLKEYEKYKRPIEFIKPQELFFLSRIQPVDIPENLDIPDEEMNLMGDYDKRWWEVAAETINKLIEEKIKNEGFRRK